MGEEDVVDETDSEQIESENSTSDEDNIARDLESERYRSTDSECSEEDCEGTLWYHENSVVCDTCWTAADLEEERQTSKKSDPWNQFRTDRPTYDNSGRVRLPGGFTDAYDWMTSNEADQPIVSIDPEKFYR